MDYKKILIPLTDKPTDVWTVDDALKGTAIIGGTGSGKTSASGKTIAMQFLKQGWGGIVLCAKKDEAALWTKYCAKAGRSNDVIIFFKGAKFKSGKLKGQDAVFNPIDYELKRDGEGAGETNNITNIFMNIYKMGNRISGDSDVKEERFWDTALRRCLNRVIELLKLAGEDLTYNNMVRLLNTSADISKRRLETAVVNYQDGIEPSEKNLQESYCLGCLYKAWIKHLLNKPLTTPEAAAFALIEDYFFRAIPEMGDRTKTVIFESFFGLAEPFLSGLLAKHFSGTTNIWPELTYEKQKIIILHFPIKEHLEAGIIAQCVFKQAFQQAIERRDTSEYPIPVFLWGDEYQYFVNSYDQLFLTTARSSRTATVFLSQNIPNYYASMGADKAGESKVNSLMGNLNTKIFHANTDAVTNEYASRLIGSELAHLASLSFERDNFSNSVTSRSESYGADYKPQIQPKDFTVLRTCGYQHNKIVDAVIMVGGREWANGKNYLKLSFEQNFETQP